jgi:anti-anti-sigma factor
MHEPVLRGAPAPTAWPVASADAAPLDVGVTVSGATTQVTMTGELDLAVAEAARARVREAWEAHRRPVVLDLNGVTFIDSAGLRSLLTVFRELRAEGGAPTLAGVSHPVQRVLELSGLTALMARP